MTNSPPGAVIRREIHEAALTRSIGTQQPEKRYKGSKVRSRGQSSQPVALIGRFQRAADDARDMLLLVFLVSLVLASQLKLEVVLVSSAVSDLMADGRAVFFGAHHTDTQECKCKTAYRFL